MLTQLARFAPLYEVPIDDASADVRATFFNTEKYDVDDAAPYFEEVVIKVAVETTAPPEQVQALVLHAERACHAAQSLRHPIPVRLTAELNGHALEVQP
jgi:organic hydroperoxide reductase OsmC/OhrA